MKLFEEHKMKKIIIFSLALIMALSLAACGGTDGGGKTTNVDGIFGEYGITDENIALESAMFVPDEGYNKTHNGSRIMAMAAFPNEDEAAGKAAWPGLVENLKKAVAEISNSSEVITEDTETCWSAYYNYEDKEVYIVATQMGAKIQIEVLNIDNTQTK